MSECDTLHPEKGDTCHTGSAHLEDTTVNLNRVFVAGNLTRDVELKYTTGGTAVAEIGLAINRKWTDKGGTTQEEVTFVDVVLWGRTAEVANEYLSKGRPVLIEGRLQLDTWQDRQTGANRSKLKVVAENLQLVGGRPEGGNGQPATQQRPQQHADSQRGPDIRGQQQNAAAGESDVVPF